MSEAQAEALLVHPMPNVAMGGVKDPTSGLCFLLTQTGDTWKVVHTSNAIDETVMFSVYNQAAGSMGAIVDLDELRRWAWAWCPAPH